MLPHVIALLFLLSFFLLLALDRQDPVGKVHLDIFLPHAAGQFGGDLVSLIGLGEVDSRDRTERFGSSGRSNAQEKATGRWASAKEVFDQTINFLAKARKTSCLR